MNVEGEYITLNGKFISERHLTYGITQPPKTGELNPSQRSEGMEG